jgi:hypothetical protein
MVEEYCDATMPSCLSEAVRAASTFPYCTPPMIESGDPLSFPFCENDLDKLYFRLAFVPSTLDVHASPKEALSAHSNIRNPRQCGVRPPFRRRALSTNTATNRREQIQQLEQRRIPSFPRQFHSIAMLPRSKAVPCPRGSWTVG